MRIRKSIFSLIVCFALILCSLSLSSFASYLPFVASVKDTLSETETTVPADDTEKETTASVTGIPTAEKEEEVFSREKETEPETTAEETSFPAEEAASAAPEKAPEEETAACETEELVPDETLLAGYAASNGAAAPVTSDTEVLLVPQSARPPHAQPFSAA